MDFEIMDSDNLDSQALPFKFMDYEVAEDLVDFPSADVGSVGFDALTFGDTAFGMTKIDRTGPGTIGLSTLRFDDSGAGSMEFDSTNSGPTDFSDNNLTGIHGTPANSGMLGLDVTGFDMLRNGPTYDHTAASDTMAPCTMATQRMYQSMKDVDVLKRSIYAPLKHNNLTGLDNFGCSRKGGDARGDPRNHSSYTVLQPSTPAPCQAEIEGAYPHLYTSATAPHLILPVQICPGASGSRKQVTAGNGKEHPPKCLAVSAPRAKITVHDWQEYRPFLEQLYVVEGAKLKDVMKILEAKFGFVATEKMYKTKIAQWGLLKNYKAAEKERLARIVKAHRDSGKTIPPLTLRNRAAKMSRVRRFCKQKKILEEILDTLPAESSSKAKVLSSTEASPAHQAAATGVLISALQGVYYPSSSSAPSARERLFDPERPFSTTSPDARIALILCQMKIYVQPRYTYTIESERYKRPSQLAFQNAADGAEIFDYACGMGGKVVSGMEILLQQKSAQGWRMLDEACTLFCRALDQLCESLFRNLLCPFFFSDWAICPDLRIHLLRFFTKFSVVRLGCNHPTSIVLYNWQEEQILVDIVTPAFEVLIDVSGEDLNHTNQENWILKSDFFDVMVEQGDYATTECYRLQTLKHFEEVFGRLDWRTRSILYDLVRIHYGQGLYELAEREYQDILQRGREDLGDKFPDEGCVCVLRDLAWIWEKRGGFAQSERYWQEVLAGAIKAWGMEGDFTVVLIAQLENLFKSQGMNPEAWLQQKFGISCI